MRSDSARWREVTPSEFSHEREGLDHVRALLPDRPPYRAWSNFEFRDSSGRWHEVDLLVLGERRLHLVELKHYRGTITGSAYRWQRGGRSFETPLLLAERKAKRLRDVIQRRLREIEPNVDPRNVPYIQQCVFLHARDGRCALPQNDRTDLFGLDDVGPNRSGLPSIATRLLEPSGGHQAGLVREDDLLAQLFDNIGFTLRREREVGSWRLTGEAVAEGDGWQDWPAEHKLSHRETARIRFYVSQPGLSPSDMVAQRQLVQRQYDLTHRLQHEGLLKPRDLVDDDLGIGLVFDRNEKWQPLDLWLADHPASLSIDRQVALVRQVAEALSYAHRNHVVHRGLCPRAITVDDTSGELTLKLSDWHVAGLDDPAAASRPTQGATRLLRILDENAVIDPERMQAEAYAAPEGRWDPAADRVRLDVFSLGAVTYHLVAGRPPAANANELRDRVGRENGLDLAGDVPEVPSALRSLVLNATRPTVSERLADLGAFLEELDQVERQLTVPGDDTETDPLEAPAGTLLGGRFELVRRLGSGSTAVGLLVTDRAADNEERVLKVALDDSAARRLAHEAEMLAALKGRAHPRLVRLVEECVITVGERAALLLESAGVQTLADALHERPRLSLDLLDRWGTDLLEALVDLDKAGIDHRDIKPANLGVREQRSDRAKHLVLFDFSLARVAADSVDVGTPQYRDPFLGTGSRLRWDSAAERYAAAATLHEMATGHVPWFGDRRSDPAAISDEATIEPEWFDPSVAGDLVAFFRCALRRDATKRHDTAAEMLAAWRAIFATTTTVPDDAEELAEAATPETPLQRAGLTARALSAIEQFGAETVADLVRVDPGQLSRMVGVAAQTRKEVRSLAKLWRGKFADAIASAASTGPVPAEGPLADPAGSAQMLVEAIGSRRATKRRHAAEVLLGLSGDVDPFATLAQLAPALSVETSAAVSISLGNVHDAWAANAEARDFLDSVGALAQEALTALGGLATVDVLVAELARRADTGAAPEHQHALRLVAGLLRAALDRMDNIERGGGPSAPISRRRRRRDGRVLLALTSDLLDAADALAAAVEGLVDDAMAVGDELVPTGQSEPVLRRLWTKDAPIDEIRLARTAARLSERVGASRRGELHDRDLPPATALRRALGGLAPSERLSAEDVQARVRARFPDLPEVPRRPRLDQLLIEANIDLRWDGTQFSAPSRPLPSSRLASRSDIPVLLAPPTSRRAEDVRLTRSVQERSFLALGVRAHRYDECREALLARYGAAVVDVTGVLVEALRAEASSAGLSWDDVRAADAESPNTTRGKGLRVLVERSLPVLDKAIQHAMDGAGEAARPVLLVEAAPLARYGHMEVLARLADITTSKPQAVWLLIPAALDSAPTLDGVSVPLAHSGQYLPLADAWLRGHVTEGASA